jgi:histidinol dehydrogenase
MQPLSLGSPDADAALAALEARRGESNAHALRVADEAIAGVRARGDAYVAEQIAKFDGVELAPADICRTGNPACPDERDRQDCLSYTAIDTAIARVASFHREQLPRSYRWTSCDTEVVHRVRPLARVGVYVPGGRAVYVSTLIMTAVPARIAGVPDIVVATTAAAAERPELQYACRKLGIREVYRAGGAAAIAALALGTESLVRVDKIVGPGNQYVTAAKARLVGEVGIDMTAGPTELVVICDETADPEWIAADLAAQAEHGPDSAVICILLGNARPPAFDCLMLRAASADEAIAVVNRIAPEHLSIVTRNPSAITERAENCGAIYVGATSAPAAGDYLVGPNHVLPTAGSARFFSPLGVYDFVKRSNLIYLGERDLEEIGPKAIALANFEGLPNHARSIAVRSRVPA